MNSAFKLLSKINFQNVATQHTHFTDGSPPSQENLFLTAEIYIQREKYPTS